jgi:hypothetical protein
MNLKHEHLEHLTDEQFASILAGDHSDMRTRLHIESCAKCQRELTSLGTAIGDLNYASLRWAEQRAARIEVPSRWVLNWNSMPGWGATVAGVLIFGVAIGAHMQINQQSAVVVRPSHTMSAPSDDELAQDNSLMLSIDNELTEQVGGQVPASDLNVSARPAHRRAISEVSN